MRRSDHGGGGACWAVELVATGREFAGFRSGPPSIDVSGRPVIPFAPKPAILGRERKEK